MTAPPLLAATRERRLRAGGEVRRLLLLLHVATLLALAAAPLPAHDFWIEPSTFTPEVGDRVALGLRVGDEPPGEALPRDPAHLLEFWARAPDGRRVEVRGVDGVDPAGILAVDAPGAWTVGYRSAETPVELPADRFEAYLREEGLEWAIERRAGSGRSGDRGRELFSRSVKTLIAAGAPPSEAAGAAWSRPLGLPFELVPVGPPCPTDAAGSVTFRALAAGQPLAGILVDARSDDPESRKVQGTTDREGRVVLPLDGAGSWLVAAVRLEELPAGGAADWRSTWTSLVFACESSP